MSSDVVDIMMTLSEYPEVIIATFGEEIGDQKGYSDVWIEHLDVGKVSRKSCHIVKFRRNSFNIIL
jgi:hypothetical protein